MDIIRVGCYLYMIHTAILCVTLFMLRMHHPRYNTYSSWISALGEKQSPYYHIFNTQIIFFGLFSLFFAQLFNRSFSTNPLSLLSNILIITASIATICIGLFPSDTHSVFHKYILGPILFTMIFGIALCTIPLIFASSSLPKYILLLNAALLCMIPLFLIIAFYRKSSKRPPLFIKRVIIQKKGLWEWIFCLTAIGWNFSLVSTLLMQQP